MNKVFKMNMYRLTHTTVFYVAIVFITIMAFALPYSGMTDNLEGLLGVVGSTTTGDDFMNSTMGAGVINILLGITLSIFVCSDYSGGFSKNIFTVHSNPKDYIGGKLMSMAVFSALMLVLYTLESIISLTIFTGGVLMMGSILGVIFFILQKWFLSIALCSLVLLVTLFTRSTAWGIVSGFLIATGGLAMGVAIFAEAFGLHWLNNAIHLFTISGASASCTLSFDGWTFLRVFIIACVWIGVSVIFGIRLIEKKDI